MGHCVIICQMLGFNLIVPFSPQVFGNVNVFIKDTMDVQKRIIVKITEYFQVVMQPVLCRRMIAVHTCVL